MNYIWSDFDRESEFSKMMVEAKRINGPDFWPIMRKVFDHDTNVLPLSRFRLWASVHTIPFVTLFRTAKYLGAAFNGAYKDPVIHNALLENWVGIPEGMTPALKVCEDFNTSMQRVQDVAHLCLCDFKPSDLEKYNSVLEIGGGYGNMCSVVHDMGFKGKYTIFDFPEIQKLQKYYLNQNGIEPNFITNVDELETYDLVLATWSLSEIPMEYREQIVNKIIDSKNWMVMYQQKVFGTINNETYFKEKFANRNAQFVAHNENQADGVNTYMIIKT